MIISQTPFRISFAGGGSDLKEYYLDYGGAVLSTTINKYIYLSMHEYFYEEKFLLKYSNIEKVDSVDEIKHRIIKQVFKEYNIKGVDFNSSADIPAGTGLGSSSAFTAGLINLCNSYLGKFISKEKIAREACNIEINKLNEPIGKQDQYACTFGGLNLIEFFQDDNVNVEKIKLDEKKMKKLEQNLLMFYLGNTRSASEILTEQKISTKIDKKKIEILHKMVKLTYNLKEELLKGNIENTSEILHAGWLYKKELASNISNNFIDVFYEKGLKAGAKGGKLLGAGGGGFLLFYAELENHDNIRKELSNLYELKFNFEDAGTKIIY